MCCLRTRATRKPVAKMEVKRVMVLAVWELWSASPQVLERQRVAHRELQRDDEGEDHGRCRAEDDPVEQDEIQTGDQLIASMPVMRITTKFIPMMMIV